MPKCGCKPKGFYTDKDKTVHPVCGKNAHVPSLQRGTASLSIPKRTQAKLRVQPNSRQGLNTGSDKDSGGDKTNMQTQKISFDELPKKTLVISSAENEYGLTNHAILNTKEKPISTYDFSAINHYGYTWQDIGPDPEDFPSLTFNDRSQWGHSKLQMLDDKALDFLKSRGYKILRVNKEK